MSAIENKKIIFYNKIVQGRIIKQAKSEINDPDIDHVTSFKYTEALNGFISDIELAINGNFGLIEDTGFCTNDQIAFITETNIEFYDQDGQNIIDYGSLQDFLDLLIAWRDFLLEPPLHGTKIKRHWNFSEIKSTYFPLLNGLTKVFKKK